MNKKILTPTLLLIGIAVIQFLTMPAFFYPGDNFSSRIEAAHWLKTGNITVPFSIKEKMPGFFQERGQYFYEDDEREVVSSKYSIGCTLAYIIPTLAEQIYNGSADPMTPSPSMLLFINLWQILLTMGFAAYLYLTMGLYTKRRWLRAILVLLTFYTTFVWHYLRAPTFEIFQFIPFIASFYHMVRYLRSRESATENKPRWYDLAAAISYSCILVWLKPFFAVHCLVMAGFAITAGKRQGTSVYQRAMNNIKTHYRPIIFALIIPAVLFAALLLVSNTFKFGSPFNLGYKQWVQNGLPHNRFSFSFFLPAVRGFLLNKGNANVFIHYPLLVPALLGLPLFFKQYGREKGLLCTLVAINLLILCFFKTWSGAWCYGPRYLVHLAVVFTLPLIPLVEWLLEKKRLHMRIVFLAVLTPILAWSLTMQFYVNSLSYFTYYQTSAAFKQLHQEHINTYFDDLTHRGTLNADLIAHRDDKADFPPFKRLKQTIPPEYRHILSQIDQFLNHQAIWNYYFSENAINEREMMRKQQAR